MQFPGEDYEVTVHLSLEDASRAHRWLNLSVPEYDVRADGACPRRSRRAFPGATDRSGCAAGAGRKGINGGCDGDLYLNIVLHPHPLFRPRARPYLDPLLAPGSRTGATVEVPTLSGAVNLKILLATTAGASSAWRRACPSRAAAKATSTPSCRS
jgi:hypothetical protein